MSMRKYWRKESPGSYLRKDGVWIHSICKGNWLVHKAAGVPAVDHIFSHRITAMTWADREWTLLDELRL